MLSGFWVYGQRSCGTPLAIQDAQRNHPQLAARYMAALQAPVPPMPLYARGAPLASIPVVVHIVLSDPEMVTDEQVRSQLAVLNADFGATNPDSSKIPGVWKSLFGDMAISFCLAQRTPEGDPTNGIDRVHTSVNQFPLANAVQAVKHASSGGADAWDPEHYLNIWVCNLGGNELGVGTPPSLYPSGEDGVVIQYDAFGTTGTLQPAFNEGRTCTHEIGHYFNLLHLWGLGDGSCTPGDYVDDTPPESGPVYDCPEFPYLRDNCSPAYPGVMTMNFMGYANDSCMTLFTQGQVARAQAALLGPRASLLTSKGCDPVILKPRDLSLERVINPVGKLCIDHIAPVITIKNRGSEPLTSLNIAYTVDQGTPHALSWDGTLASLDTLKLDLPASVVDTGHHVLTVYATSVNGEPDGQPANDTTRGAFYLDPVATLPLMEGFEADTFPPPGWTIRNPDGGITWERTAAATHSGQYAVRMRNLDYAQNGPIDDLITPVVHVTGDSAFLFFYVAAAVQSDPAGNNRYWDTLQVLVSYDCGQTGTPVYKKWGGQLITDSTPVLTEFIPRVSQWRRDSINLTPYIHRGPFQVIFRNTTNFENNIYLDDINLITRQTNPILKEEKVLVVPNPTSGSVQVQFLDYPDQLKAVAIYNSIGQLVQKKTAADVNAENRIEFNLAHAPNGIYFVKILYADHQRVKKIIKIQ